MSNRHFNSLVDQAKELGADTISVFGYGEPLLDLGIINKVAYCTKLGLDTFITTNASLLQVDMATMLLRAGLKKIRFSCHGVYKNYDKVHKPLRFEDTIRNITNFISKNRVKFHSQCRTAMSVIPMHGESVEEIRKFWDNAMDELEIWRPHNWTDGKGFRDLTKKRKKTCGRPYKGPVQINSDGNMMVCCFDYDAKMTVGNTHTSTIEEILKSDRFRFVRKCHDNGTLGNLPCSTCDQLNIGDDPLLYSSVDKACSIGRTSSTKFNLEV
jgi:radical SAM protein with 4Fe4S-binding SPASM domain